MTPEQIAELVANTVAAMLPGAPEAPITTPAQAPARKAGRPKGSKNKTKATLVAASCITAGTAWTLLGADEAFEPKDHDRPASNYQLYRLNVAGLLTV